MTELIWDGKYKDGKKQGPVRIALPFQTIETVNESAQDRQRSLELFAQGRETEWRNRLIWGDKKYVLPSLLPEFAGKVNLIYIDPPFDTGADFSFTATIPDHPDTPEDETTAFTKEPSIIEQKAYRDTWGRGLDSYLQWFYETTVMLRELLADNGSVYVHLDENLVHYAKAVLDEVFGQENFQREIVWRIGWISGYKSAAKNWIRNHDVILFYVKDSHHFTFNKEYVPYAPEYHRRGEDGPPPEGKGYPIEDVWNANPFEFALKGEESLDSIQIKSFSAEKTGFPTQKNESVVKRIIKASTRNSSVTHSLSQSVSNPTLPDLVLDCFCGSGTTAAVAEKLGRRWIACDLSRFAIHTTRKRLLGIPNVRPFVVQNLGKYERQAWQAAEFGATPVAAVYDRREAEEVGAHRAPLQEQREREAAYRQFILDLYHATPITGYTWLHGTKSGRMVHVGAVDAPVTLADVKAIAREVWKGVGSGKNAGREAGGTKAAVDILGWEFAFEVNELAKQVAAESRVDVAFKKIPHDAMDKRAVEAGDVKFFELGALTVDVKQKGREVTLKLTDFVIPTDDIPEEARKAIKHWSQLVDYWAVDWDYKDDTFHNQWQSYRTRKNPKIELEAKYTYSGPGKYVVVVKVIDILGNDTTKTLEVEIR